MALQQNTAEGGTAGTTITAANSGGGTNDAFFLVNIAGSGTGVYDNSTTAHGSLSFHMTTTATSGDFSFVEYRASGSLACSARFYLYLNSLPSPAYQALVFRDNAGQVITDFDILTNGKVLAQDSTGTTMSTTTSALSTGVWYRMEFYATVATTSTGSGSFSYYLGDSTTPIETLNFSGENYGTGNITQVLFGKVTASASATDFNMDDLAFVDGSAGLIGPANGSAVGAWFQI
jgi:hypothetical protein